MPRRGRLPGRRQSRGAGRRGPGRRVAGCAGQRPFPLVVDLGEPELLADDFLCDAGRGGERPLVRVRGCERGQVDGGDLGAARPGPHPCRGPRRTSTRHARPQRHPTSAPGRPTDRAGPDCGVLCEDTDGDPISATIGTRVLTTSPR